MTKKVFTKSKSTWQPKEVHHTVQTFIEDFTQRINNELQNTDFNKKQLMNLKKEEQEALESLMKRTDIIICNADKGGAVVIMDVKNYIEELKKQRDNFLM